MVQGHSNLVRNQVPVDVKYPRRAFLLIGYMQKTLFSHCVCVVGAVFNHISEHVIIKCRMSIS